MVPLVFSWWHSSPKRCIRQSRAARCSSVSCEMFSPGPFSLGWSCALESSLKQNLPFNCNYCWGILSVINYQLLCQPCQLLALAVSCSRAFPSWFGLSYEQLRAFLPVLHVIPPERRLVPVLHLQGRDALSLVLEVELGSLSSQVFGHTISFLRGVCR